ncbi:hypothetical protein RHS01_07698 [Rhizoctonia solani]|uniref:Transmembrane protein n=1 Tax=Rhizoctonia solani TaxID=456999 RepID=A0A8H7IA77_9AGAM|nr:hypothetical protein RHS01_07698 [Rhizoctonia solani]
MSALLGGLGSSYAKPRPKEDTVKSGSTSSEDSPIEKVGNRQQDPHLGIAETPIDQENPQIHFESAASNVREYLPTETQSEDYGLGKEAKFWKTYVKETDRWDGELVDGWNKSLDVLLDSSIRGTVFGHSNSVTPIYFALCEHCVSRHPRKGVVSFFYDWPYWTPMPPSSSAPAKVDNDRALENAGAHFGIAFPHSFITTTICDRTMHLCMGSKLDCRDPVFCVCGLVVGFYIWSSLAASVLKSFPYTTMASRILRSGFVKPLHIFLRYGAATTLLLIYITAIIIMLCLIFLTICIPSCGYAIAGWVNPMLDWFQRLVDWLIDDDLDKQEEEPSQDIVASQAISWMITNCEVPRSVDVALQAIAGANKRLPREPLEDRAGTRLVSLYIRALFVLGSNAESMNDSHKDELEIMIRDLQAGSKNQVTNLITDGTFVPNSQNLEALRIGSNAPHQSYRRLKPLHPAALLSLVNAIAMLASCAPNKGVSNPALIIIHLLHSVLSTPPTTKTSLFEMSGILAVCALSQSRSVESPGVAQLNCLIRTEQSLRALADYMQGKTSSEIVFWSSVLELSSHPEAYGLDASSEPDSECLLPASGISYPETDLTSMISHLHVHATTAFSDIVDKLFSLLPSTEI